MKIIKYIQSLQGNCIQCIIILRPSVSDAHPALCFLTFPLFDSGCGHKYYCRITNQNPKKPTLFTQYLCICMRGITVHYFAVIKLSLSGCPHNKLFGWQPHFSSSSSSRRSDEHKKGNSKILESTARMRPTHGIKKKLFLAEFLSK